LSTVLTASDSIRSVIDRRADENPNDPFLLDPDTHTSCSYAQLRVLCAQIAEQVARLGIAQGESVAYAMHNGLPAAITVLGLQYGGYRAVSINLVAGTEIIGYVLSHSETRAIITQTAVLDDMDKALASDAFQESERARPEIVTFENAPGGETLRFQWQLASNEPVTIDMDLDATLPQGEVTKASDGLLMYTSGTTGRPKGVVLSHGNLLAGGRNVCDGHELLATDRALCVLPLFHINGLCVTLMGPLVSASSVVIPARFSTSRFWDWIERMDCTWFSVVPTQVSYLLRDAGDLKDLPKLRFGRSASAPLSPDVHGSFEKQFKVPLIETMGLTETAAQILSNPMPPGKRKLGSPGLPVGVKCRIVDKEGQDVVANVEGELLIQGDAVMQRYLKNTTATDEALTAEGWLHTGDLGRVDDEGYVFITGRLKELIIKGGENIAPREIDDALYRHPDVVEAAAFAVECTDYGQRVEAAVCLKPGSKVDADALLDIVTSSVGAFKCPDRIHLLEELPKGPSGKIQRNKLCDMQFT